MAEISEHNLYDINDLVAKWEKGWRELAKFGKAVCPLKLENSADRSKPPVDRILLAFQDVLDPFFGIGKSIGIPQFCPDSTEILNLVASSSGKPYEVSARGTTLLTMEWYRLGAWSKSKPRLRKVLDKVTNAFATSESYQEVLRKIATKGNVRRFRDFWSQRDACWSKGEYLSHKIEPRLKSIMRWLECGLNSKQACDKAWWNCLWLYMEPEIEAILAIKKQVDTGTPLWREQIDKLKYYMPYGYPGLSVLTEDDAGAHRIHVALKPRITEIMTKWSPFKVMSIALLVQPAFMLAQQLQDFFPKKPRYLRQCRAPSCKKWFYTGRKDATNCPGSRGGKKNKCSLQWNRYKRYLQKVGNNPEKDWHNEKLQEEFISYDKS
ncbi:MAG: hypothetical protein KAY65_13905 [Planctomycetes bacterium]|nr:hypothetical protein [Planctomycetota bacterium]